MHVLVVVGLALGEPDRAVLVAGGKALAVVAVDMGGDGQVAGEMAGEDEAYAEVEVLAIGDGFVVAADLVPQPQSGRYSPLKPSPKATSSPQTAFRPG